MGEMSGVCPVCGVVLDATRAREIAGKFDGIVSGEVETRVAARVAVEAERAANLRAQEVRHTYDAQINDLTARIAALAQQSEVVTRRASELDIKARDLAEREQKIRTLADEQVRLQVDRARLDAEKAFNEKVQHKDILIAEKDKQLLQFQSTVQGLEAKLQQGSATAKGIIAEKALVEHFRANLPRDNYEVEEHGQGRGKGTDVIIHVRRAGERVGRIIVDDKWAGAWSRDWPEKVWDDMQLHKADFAYIAANPSALPDEVKDAGFGPAPSRRTGVRVWVVDRSNLPLVLAVVMDAGEKILKMAELKALYGAGSEAVQKFQDYLAKGYEVDLRDKARHMSAAVKALQDMQKKVAREYGNAMEALQSYWHTELRAHQALSACFGANLVKALPPVSFERLDT